MGGVAARVPHCGLAGEWFRVWHMFQHDLHHGGAISRLETLALMSGIALPLPAVRAQLLSAIDAFVQVRRHRGERSVELVAEVSGATTR